MNTAATPATIGYAEAPTTLKQRFPMFVRILSSFFVVLPLLLLYVGARAFLGFGPASPVHSRDASLIFVGLIPLVLLGVPAFYVIFGGLYADIRPRARTITKGLFLFNLRFFSRTRSFDEFTHFEIFHNTRNGAVGALFLFIHAVGPKKRLPMPGYFYKHESAAAELQRLSELTGIPAAA